MVKVSVVEAHGLGDAVLGMEMHRDNNKNDTCLIINVLCGRRLGHPQKMVLW